MTVDDDESLGITLSPTTLTVNEGSTADYTVQLSVQPTADVTVNITGGGDVTVNPTSLTFSSVTWNTAQTVTVTADQDDDGADDTLTVGHAVDSSSAAEYVGATLDGLPVTVEDDESLGITLSPTTLTVNEGSTADYTVKLSVQPTADVTINITGGGDVTVNPTPLTFSSVTWNTAQTVTVTAVQDDDGADDTLTVGHAVATGSAPEYVGASLDGLPVTVDDDDPAVTVSFEKEIHYTIEGASGAAGVEVLLSAPLQTEVTIPLAVLSQSTADPDDYLVDDHAGYASDPGLTFSPGETFGYIFIKAVLDTVEEDTETVVLGFGTLPEGVSEGSPNRSTVEIKDAIQVSFANSSYTVEEGGAGVEVVVKLNKPRNNLRIPLTANGHGGADASDFTGVPQEVSSDLGMGSIRESARESQ